MQEAPVPVTLGSPWFRAIETDACRFTEARFSPGEILSSHMHDRPIMSVMLSGSFETAISGRRLACLPEYAFTEPCEERHANYIGQRGARVLVCQPDPDNQPLFESIAPLLDDVALVRDPLVSLDARRALAEMDQADGVSRLALDALLLGMLVQVSRSYRSMRASHTPSWLSRVRDLLHDEFREPPSLSTLAAVANVTPSHVCHAFRSHFGMPVGEYVRRLRASWAAEQLRMTDQSLSAVALAAGYSDQSHFTRECRRWLGIRPSEYRRLSRNRAQGAQTEMVRPAVHDHASGNAECRMQNAE